VAKVFADLSFIQLEAFTIRRSYPSGNILRTKKRALRLAELIAVHVIGTKQRSVWVAQQLSITEAPCSNTIAHKSECKTSMKPMFRGLNSEIDRDRFREQLLKYTRKAFHLIPELDKPRILDVGCGSGVPTIELAKLSKGEVVGLDVDQSLLDELNRKVERENLSNRVKTRRCSLFEMDFPDESFDIIWAEGSISVIGFEKGLNEWRRLLKPGGFLVVHAETKSILNKLKKIPDLGYKLLNQFSLPKDAHWTEYYRPMEVRIKELRAKYKNNHGALQMLRRHQNEIDTVKRNPEEFSSAFYIMQKL
jgi:ubiquinone/menaquinone biosynthesis C-methylase UbiE